MPTVLTSGDRADVEQRLTTGPALPANTPSALVATISWITAIITSLLYFTVPHGFPWTAHGLLIVLMECSWTVHGPHGVLVDCSWSP